jgi:thymidylate synthase
MRSIAGESYTSIFKQAAALLVEDGLDVAPRGRPTRELQHVSMTLRTPRRRYPNLPKRNANIFALVAETLWVLGGRNDLAFIRSFLPRMADYSENGSTLSGAYGPRMRSWHGVDQLRHVIETLQGDPDSRRAVITLLDPVIDTSQGNLDVPCCNTLHFIMRGDKLDLAVFSRSMDVMWGSAINFFEWTTLQEAVAYWLGVTVGDYHHYAGSLHIYNEFLGRAAQLVSQTEPRETGSLPFDLPLAAFDQALTATFDAEARYRSGDTGARLEYFGSRWLAEADVLLRTFWIAKTRRDYHEAASLIRSQPATVATEMALDQLAFMERTDA